MKELSNILVMNIIDPYIRKKKEKKKKKRIKNRK